VPNRRSFDHIGNFNFQVEIDGVTQSAFIEVSGLETTTEVEEFRDGSDIVEHRRPGSTAYSNIVLKRGFTDASELWDWRKAVIDGKIERRSGSIIICGDDGSEIMRYNFFEAWPCRWKLSRLSTIDAGTIVEEVELAVEKIERG